MAIVYILKKIIILACPTGAFEADLLSCIRLQDTVAVHTGYKKGVCCYMRGLTIRLGEYHFTEAKERKQWHGQWKQDIMCR